MSVKILLYTLLKQIGIFLVVSFLVFRGTFVESDSLGLNLSTGVSLLLSVILWGIINLHTYWLIPGYLFQRRYKKVYHIFELPCWIYADRYGWCYLFSRAILCYTRTDAKTKQ